MNRKTVAGTTALPKKKLVYFVAWLQIDLAGRVIFAAPLSKEDQWCVHVHVTNSCFSFDSLFSFVDKIWGFIPFPI